MPKEKINRREVIQSLGLISGHILFPSVLTGFLACTAEERRDYGTEFFTDDEFEAIIEIVDIIIPKTSTMSASEVHAQVFLDEVFAKCLTQPQQELIKDGITRLITELKKVEDKVQFLSEVDRKAYGGDEDYAFFRTIKQYTLVGFFTSQEGITKASNYVELPGEYKGEIPVGENTLNYAKTNMRFYL
jgi:hypothetical protein